jgi:hypothetical protein
MRRDGCEHTPVHAHDFAMHLARKETVAFGDVVNRVRDRLEECDHQLVAARPHHGAVPFEVQPHMCADVVGHGVKLPMNARHLGEVVVGAVDRGKPRGGGLDCLARLEQRLEAHAMAAHEQFERARDGFAAGAPHLRAAAAPGLGQHQAFGFQHAQRLAHRSAA